MALQIGGPTITDTPTDILPESAPRSGLILDNFGPDRVFLAIGYTARENQAFSLAPNQSVVLEGHPEALTQRVSAVCATGESAILGFQTL